jgi:hypothetical protein
MSWLAKLTILLSLTVTCSQGAVFQYTISGIWDSSAETTPLSAPNTPFVATFDLSSPVYPDFSDPNNFEVNGVPITYTLGSTTINYTATVVMGHPSNQIGFGVPSDPIFTGFIFDPDGVLFSGSTSAPVLNTGTFFETGSGLTNPPDPVVSHFSGGTLTVTATPEPLTGLLIGVFLSILVVAQRHTSRECPELR